MQTRETVCLKCQNLFSGKNIPKCHLLEFLPSMLSVNCELNCTGSLIIVLFATF